MTFMFSRVVMKPGTSRDRTLMPKALRIGGLHLRVKPEAVFLVRTYTNTYVLRSGNSLGQITLGKKGIIKAYVIGSGQAKVSRDIDGTLESQVYSCTSGSRGGCEYYG